MLHSEPVVSRWSVMTSGSLLWIVNSSYKFSMETECVFSPLLFIFIDLLAFCIEAHLPLYLLNLVRAFQSSQLLPLQLADLKKLSFICRLGGFHCALLSRSVKMLNRMIASNAARSVPLLTLLCSGKLTIKSHHGFLVFSQHFCL